MNMTNILSVVVGLLAFAAAIWQLMAFLGAKDPQTGHQDMWAGTNHLWLAILAAIVACACAAYYFIRNKKEVEEIHITDR
jgi:uncharacterized membrane protein YidH (DUF202 family)